MDGGLCVQDYGPGPLGDGEQGGEKSKRTCAITIGTEVSRYWSNGRILSGDT